MERNHFGKFFGSFGPRVQPSEHGGLNDQIERFVTSKDGEAGGVAVTREELVNGIAKELYNRQTVIAAFEDLEKQSGQMFTEDDIDFLKNAKIST